MDESNTLDTSVRRLPLLPLRDVVVFPEMVVPLFVGRSKSIRALEEAMENEGHQVVLVAQKNASKDEPKTDDLYRVGTIATILQMLKLPDGTVKVLVEGGHRVALTNLRVANGGYRVEASVVEDVLNEEGDLEPLRRAVLTQFEQYLKVSKKIPPELLNSLQALEEPARLTDSLAIHLPIKLEHKQVLLETLDICKRLELLLGHLEGELDIAQVEKRIRSRVKRQMEKSQREYYLNEQVKAIQKELGDGEEAAAEELEKRILQAKMPKAAREKAESELRKLKMMSPMSAEAAVIRNYIETLTDLPWNKRTAVGKDLAYAQQVLDEDHYGLEKVKERILEYLAVHQRVDVMKAPILCLVGPPGVGKTSLGQSIARAVNRKFIRVALGGVRDEAEIRGHRRTYIGSMPGKVLQNMAKVKVRNPLFLLDEVDKMGMDHRGDPASALLEVLDPEQNNTFVDHYVEVEYDLSEVLFIATSNSFNIPAPLLDRMEIIRLSGYTEDEKLNIARRHLLEKQIKNNGVKKGELEVTDAALLDIIRYYTREAGVRNLDREISKLCRKAIKEVLLGKREGGLIIDSHNLNDYLGVRRYSYGVTVEENRIGLVNGLAWTEVGGDLLTIECVVLPGKGKTTTTGKLGDVMQESIQTAMSVVRARADVLGIDTSFYEEKDIHVHFPEGAVPKDGPSAGIGICTALVSSLTKIPVKSSVAMTGEITLRGEVLPIGGLKEKLLAAHRGGITMVLIPHENVKDLQEIPANITEGLEIKPVRWIDEVLGLALASDPHVRAHEKANATEVVELTKKGSASEPKSAVDEEAVVVDESKRKPRKPRTPAKH
jgi:ATP-dependent Lon protease